MINPNASMFASMVADLVNRLRIERSMTERQRLLTELRDLRTRSLDDLSASSATSAVRLASIVDSVNEVSRLVDWTIEPAMRESS